MRLDGVRVTVNRETLLDSVLKCLVGQLLLEQFVLLQRLGAHVEGPVVRVDHVLNHPNAVPSRASY